jgi:hypothetical protein
MSAAYGYGFGLPQLCYATGTISAAIGYRISRQPNALPSNWSRPEKAPKARSPTNSALRPMFSQNRSR